MDGRGLKRGEEMTATFSFRFLVPFMPFFSGPSEINLITFFFLNIVQNSVGCASPSQMAPVSGTIL